MLKFYEQATHFSVRQMVFAMANIQARQFERGCCQESYVEDAVLQSKIITYTDCVIVTFFWKGEWGRGLKIVTGNLLARKLHKTSRSKLSWSRGRV